MSDTFSIARFLLIVIIWYLVINISTRGKQVLSNPVIIALLLIINSWVLDILIRIIFVKVSLILSNISAEMISAIIIATAYTNGIGYRVPVDLKFKASFLFIFFQGVITFIIANNSIFRQADLIVNSVIFTVLDLCIIYFFLSAGIKINFNFWKKAENQ